ncbi:MAG: hypothetical protein HRU40_16325 [Saprospiraceae bacterium]|nr:hypothetical protein [Saprospiraceae bacterium]
MRRVLYLLLVGAVIWGCQSESGNSWKPLDLLEYGLPITVEAPDSTTVKASDLGILQDVTLEGVSDPNYFIQIYASKANNTDIAQIKADQVSMVRSNPYFTQIVEEEESGFIYETQIDSTNYYSFQYVYLQGDKEYIFTTGLAKTFDLKQVEKMYVGVKQEN